MINIGQYDASDFIRKLYKILTERPDYAEIISWNHSGKSFIIKKPEEFTSIVLPAIFNHKNLASFVRQLNKYGFHKIKSKETIQAYGTNCWEFMNELFQNNRTELLANIKRKVSSGNKSGVQKIENTVQQTAAKSPNHHYNLNSIPPISIPQSFNFPQTSKTPIYAGPGSSRSEINPLASTTSSSPPILMNGSASNLLNGLSSKSSSPGILNGIPDAALVNADTRKDSSTIALVEEIEKLKQSNYEIRSYIQLLTKNYRIAFEELFCFRKILSAQDHLMQNVLKLLMNQKSSDFSIFNEPNVVVEGKENDIYREYIKANEMKAKKPVVDEENKTYDESSIENDIIGSSAASNNNEDDSSVIFANSKVASTNTNEKKKKREKSKARTPLTWKAPPRVLLVEDDSVSRTIGSKLLQHFGCKFESVSDGTEAIEKMNREHYDIVLMDIGLPTLDGMQATNSIRKFDKNTPIIAMTSNIKREDCLKYLTSGMNDILPKPFSSDSLLVIIDRYCSHLSTKENEGRADKEASVVVGDDFVAESANKRIRTE